MVLLNPSVIAREVDRAVGGSLGGPGRDVGLGGAHVGERSRRGTARSRRYPPGEVAAMLTLPKFTT